MQADAAENFSKECREADIHVCPDTGGYASEQNLNKIMPYSQEILFDLKLMNDEKHRQYTGVSNRLILRNLKLIGQIHPNLRIRFPLIPGVNSDGKSVEEPGNFLSKLKHSYPLICCPITSREVTKKNVSAYTKASEYLKNPMKI